MKKILILLATLISLSACQGVPKSAAFLNEMQSAKTVLIVVQETNHINLNVDKSPFVWFEKDEIKRAQKSINDALYEAAPHLIGEAIAERIRAQGYATTVQITVGRKNNLPPADIVFKIERTQIRVLAYAAVGMGKRYFISLEGNPSIQTQSEQRKPIDVTRTYPTFGNDRGGVLLDDDVFDQKKIMEQFNVTLLGWLDSRGGVARDFVKAAK